MRISVIIPSYRNPAYLDLCLSTAFKHQAYENQIICVLDGYAEESQSVIEKYPDLNVVAFEQNKGQTAAHNTGVVLAENEAILIVNDDNVFPPDWDSKLKFHYDASRVCAPNQIEPTPSIFESFIIKDFGKTPAEFKLDEFVEFTNTLALDKENFLRWKQDGQTWPLFMSKKWYMALNGIDASFPSPAVADHDFFLRCEMAGLMCGRIMDCNFYHFAGAATKAEGRAEQHNMGEIASHEYFQWKWGFPSQMKPKTHSKAPHGQTVRGIHFK
jgi:glycosyltransferase involved in cell wall biosynthesis